MTIQEHVDISTMSSRAFESVRNYEDTMSESDRLQALEQIAGLARALEKPADAVYKLFMSPTIPMAVKIAHDLDIFALLSQEDCVTCERLAKAKSADPQLIERIMRVLVCNGYASRCGLDKYTATAFSRQMMERTTIGTMESMFIDVLPMMHKAPEFLEKTNYKNPADPKRGPLQYAYNTPLPCWEWLAENPDALKRFNTFMEGSRANRPHWADFFPVQEQLLDGAVPDRPLVVDIGGGRGHDLTGFKQRFSEVKGTLVLEDLPAVIDDIKSLDPEIKKLKHDFFTPQPVKGARAYYLRWILHDWSDEQCRIILSQISAAMEKGYSKLLIEEHILQDENAGLQETLIDMAVMVFCPGEERTRRRWTNLLDSVGLTIVNFWVPAGQTKGIIEAEVKC